MLALYPVHTYLISTAHKRSQSDEYVKPGQKKQKLEDGKYAGIYRQQQKLITSFQLCIGYQIGYNPVITFSLFWTVISQTSSKKKIRPDQFWCLCNCPLCQTLVLLQPRPSKLYHESFSVTTHAMHDTESNVYWGWLGLFKTT